jgi:hypothetical protein
MADERMRRTEVRRQESGRIEVGQEVQISLSS